MANDILLSSNKKSWKVGISHDTELERDPKKLEHVKKIIKRDNGVCYYCDFKSDKFQEIHHLDNDPNNYDHSNLVTVCPFCHQCYHLNIVGNSDSGRLIWLPEISQQELNHISRIFFIVLHYNMNGGRGVSDHLLSAVRHITAALENRVLTFERIFDSEGCSNPTILSQVLISMTDEQYNKRAEFLKDVRLMPYKSRFANQIAYYADNIFKDEYDIDKWESLYDKYKDKIV